MSVNAIKNVVKAVLFFVAFSLKQKKILTWWAKESPYKDYNGIIADGAIRAGKTVPMALSFVFWAIFSTLKFSMIVCFQHIWVRVIIFKYFFTIS